MASPREQRQPSGYNTKNRYVSARAAGIPCLHRPSIAYQAASDPSCGYAHGRTFRLPVPDVFRIPENKFSSSAAIFRLYRGTIILTWGRGLSWALVFQQETQSLGGRFQIVPNISRRRSTSSGVAGASAAAGARSLFICLSVPTTIPVDVRAVAGSEVPAIVRGSVATVIAGIVWNNGAAAQKRGGGNKQYGKRFMNSCALSDQQTGMWMRIRPEFPRTIQARWPGRARSAYFQGQSHPAKPCLLRAGGRFSVFGGWAKIAFYIQVGSA